ncbi:MAG: ABC transporter ATP-binding protein [Chloroflexi bacterium]|nr:ABC transporter ATP-binding protein [Chloroflexota bacterium]
MLKVEALESGYGPMQVLWRPSLEVREGSITCLLGPNGVGKTTMLRTILSLLEPWGGKINYQGKDITNWPSHRKVGEGIALVPEGKHLFANMSVRENLTMGAYLREAAQRAVESLELVYSLFPVLKERAEQRAGSLSGGEQQMVTIARALMTRPRLIMLDEPSQGLAPKLVTEVFETVKRMRTEIGLTVLLVEQNVEASLDLADYVYIMHEGIIKAEGSPADIRALPNICEAYLGI